MGLVLLALWLLTPHAVADWNFNVLFFTPLGFWVFRYPRIRPLVMISWVVWLILLLYLQAWYLLPVVIPGALAMKNVSLTPLKK